MFKSLLCLPTLRLILASPGFTRVAACSLEQSSVCRAASSTFFINRGFHLDQPRGQSEKIPAADAKKMTNEEWAKKLTTEQYYVTREHGTEAPFSGKYYKHKGEGIYTCSNCGTDLFNSKTKYDSGSGWPSFYDAIEQAEAEGVATGVYRRNDVSGGMVRTEILCKNCNAHLGHVFDDGPKPTGLRYCINSASLKFQPKKLQE